MPIGMAGMKEYFPKVVHNIVISDKTGWKMSGYLHKWSANTSWSATQTNIAT